MSPVQTVPGATWFSGVWSSGGHSGNGLSSHSSTLDVVAFSSRPGKGCDAILSYRLPPNQTHCLGCLFSEQT